MGSVGGSGRNEVYLLVGYEGGTIKKERTGE